MLPRTTLFLHRPILIRQFGTRSTFPLLNSIKRTPSDNSNPPKLVVPLLPSEKDARRTDFTKWATTKMDSLQTTLLNATQAINDVTGYSAIEKLKQKIEKEEQTLDQCRDKLRTAKTAYSKAVEKQTASQREINELLQRKNSWKPEDLERFTELYRNDHVIESEVTKCQAASESLEQELEEHRATVTSLISSKYHEEQIWSDKIRRVSTWGTWALMALNIFVFIVAQLGLEPWRRRRMMDMFEERIKHLVVEETQIQGEAAGKNRDQQEQDQLAANELAVQRSANTVDLQWNNLLLRLDESIRCSSAMLTRPQELLYSFAAVSLSSFLLGSLMVLAFK